MTDAGWQAFKTRILLPMEAGDVPDVTGMSGTTSVADLLACEDAFECGADWMIRRRYTGRDGMVYIGGTIQLHDGGAASLDAARDWAKASVKTKRYRRSANSSNGRIALQTTGWRKPTLEIYINPETKRTSASLVAWETDVAHDDLTLAVVQRPMMEAAHVS